MGIMVVCRLRSVWRRAAGRTSEQTRLKIGYARVSTRRQRLDLQLHALRKVGCDIIYADRASGAGLQRKGLSRALAASRAGDLMVVWKLDRLGRKLAGLLNTIDRLRNTGVRLQIATENGAPYDMSSPEDRFMLSILGCFAELEYEMIRTRSAEGIAAARRKMTESRLTTMAATSISKAEAA